LRTKKTAFIAFKADKDMIDAITTLAELRDVTVSALCREAIKQFLELSSLEVGEKMAEMMPRGEKHDQPPDKQRE